MSEQTFDEVMTDVELQLRGMVRLPEGPAVHTQGVGDHPLTYRPDQPVFPPPLAVLPAEVYEQDEAVDES